MRYGMWTALATGLVLAAGGVSQASDTIRLGGPSAQAAIQGGTDTELVRGRGGYGGGRGYYGGGGYGGGRGYYGGGFYGRGYYGGGYYRPYYASYYRPYYYGNYYGGGYYGSGYGGGNYGGGYNTPYYASYYPCAGDSAPAQPLQTQATYAGPQSTYSAPVPRLNVQPMLPASDGTYPYNGGPNQPIPMPPPNDNLAPISGPRGIIPLDGKLVSFPRETGGGVSPVSAPITQGWNYVANGNVAGQLKTTAPGVAYPAYGENAVPTPRKTSNR